MGVGQVSAIRLFILDSVATRNLEALLAYGYLIRLYIEHGRGLAPSNR